MGEVYRARDTKLRREVALKILPPAFAVDPDRRARFTREAHVLASLNHPHIASIYGIEEADPSRGSGQATVALVLELVEGPTLAERIDGLPPSRLGRSGEPRRSSPELDASGGGRAKGSRLPIGEALKFAAQIADALDAAHEKGIIHRDLKPANIKLTEDGRVKVLDFGLAKALDTGSASLPDRRSLGEGGSGERELSISPTMTAMASKLGVIVGTAAYMSPEQAKGKPVEKRADIWAFGCVLYEMLTGQRAFAGEDVTDFVVAVMTKEPDWAALPPSTPPRIVELLKRCLKKDARERLRDTGDARMELQADAALVRQGRGTEVHRIRRAPVRGGHGCRTSRRSAGGGSDVPRRRTPGRRHEPLTFVHPVAIERTVVGRVLPRLVDRDLARRLADRLRWPAPRRTIAPPPARRSRGAVDSRNGRGAAAVLFT